MRYFLARILQFQFHRALCREAGYKGPLHRCSIYGNKAAGEKLNKMLAMGQSKPWPEALEALTGEKQMDASALADYFAPIKAWLDEQNKANRYPVGLIVAAHNSLCSNHIYKFGTEAQKEKYLIPLASGKAIGAWSLTEPEAGSDAGGTRTTAARCGNQWVLNGAKTFTTNGQYADFCVAMAVTDKSKGSHGISAFILEKRMAGLRPGKKENKLGMRASDTSEVIFSDCRVPQENLLGPEGEGFTGSLKILDGGRISIAALALGMAQGALETAPKKSNTRKQLWTELHNVQRQPVHDHGTATHGSQL